ncbi:MAG: 16S rRNA (guanine(966)-N(2))-methyltransferase RsmD [Prevotella sp.]|nr:16S rRNA (guanine(966)-N(2))-methyltransferase RsmD [Prevotella sp.]
MRIITGLYKGRHFDIPRTFKARPTTDFAKENIFNVLNGYLDFEGATALDLFSGTGSIALEMLSRGCKQVISVEQDRDHHAFIVQCLKKLGIGAYATASASQSCLPLRADAFRFIKSCHTQFDLIFADPPYTLKELPEIPALIFEQQMLKPGGIFVFEHSKNHSFADSPYFKEHRSYGSVNFTLFSCP